MSLDTGRQTGSEGAELHPQQATRDVAQVAEDRRGTKAVLEARGIHVRFTTRAGTACVLNDMGFACHEGEMMGLVGESGSGKTVGGL